MIQKDKTSQMSGKTGLFRGYNQKMALFFDCKYVIWKSRNVHSGRHEMQLAKGTGHLH